MKSSDIRLFIFPLFVYSLRILYEFNLSQTGKPEPNVEFAAAIGEQDLDLIEAKYNSGIYDFVQKLPGITSKNIDAFLRKLGSMNKALCATEEELKEVLGNTADAQALYSIFHLEQRPAEEDDSVKQKGKGKFRKRPLKS